MTPDPAQNRDVVGLRAPSPAPEPGKKKRRPFSAKALFRRLILVTILLVAIVIAAGIFGEPVARCMHLRHTIKDALATATQVRVIEHSNEWDDPLAADHEKYREKIYSTVTLSPQQIAELRAALPISADFSKTLGHACHFQDHHRIEALQPDSTAFTLDLCFHCGELRITGEEQRIFPERWGKSLRKFIASLGLKPDGPWPKP